MENLRVQAIEDRISAELALGRQRDVLAELEGLVQTHPLHERYRFQLMLVLYREGRQNDALEVYQQAADRLRDELGVDPGTELQELRLSILRQDPALVSPLVPIPHRPQLPNLAVQLTSFVGRESEAAEVCKQLAGARLVTLTGAGGVGKTRLAVEIALNGGDAFPDGAWMVELATLQEPALIESAVADVLGVRELPHQPLREAIVERLWPTAPLLVLDNCEHLLDGVADLGWHLLRACPALRVLCTSRERLGITGEVVYPIAGLSVPVPEECSAAQAQTSSAVKLFVDRASATQAHFRLTDDNAAAVAEITRRLDGLPLAIELAAARTANFGAGQIAARLEDRFRLLSHGGRQGFPRHETLRAVVAWSYGLLTEPEQRFFGRLAVFVGGFTCEAAEAVCVDTGASEIAGDPADLLARLVDKSLVVADAVESSEYRYRLLETLRVYGLEELTRCSEADQVRNAHARYYLGLATVARAGLRGPDHALWLDRLRTEHPNLRAAMDWALCTCDDETAAGIAASLWTFWDLDGHYREGRDWLRRVLADGRELPAAVHAQALMGVVHLGIVEGDPDEEITAACRHAVQLSRAADDTSGLVLALEYLGYIALLARRLVVRDPVLFTVA